MSRVFTKNTSNYMSLGTSGIGSLVNGASAVSFHTWARYSSLTATIGSNRILGALIDGSGTVGLVMSVHNGTSAVLHGRGRSQAADSLQSRNGTTALSINTYYSLGIVFNFTADSITTYVNGVNDSGGGAIAFGSNTYVHGTPTNEDAIGTQMPPSVSLQWDGEIESFAVWNTALSGTDFTNLAAGAWPGAIATANLVSLHILAGYDSPEPNLVSGGPSGTITGSVPAGSNNPTLWRPWYGDIGQLVGSA